MTSVSGKVSRLVAPVIFKAMGMDFFKLHQWLLSTGEWSDEERAQWRLDRLNTMMDHCWDHVPFYQSFWASAGVTRKRLQSIDDLNSYPTLNKDIIKGSKIPLRSDDSSQIRKKLNSTGGTTGQPLQYFQDLELWALTQAYNLWGWGLAGYQFGDRLAIIGGYSLVPANASLKDRFRYVLEQKTPISGVHFDEKTGHSIFSQLNKVKPEFVYGYPSVLSMFGQFLSDNGLRLESVRGVFTTAEMLQDIYREKIEQGFKCKVWDQYGCNDGGIMSYECSRHQGHHYNDLQAIAQVTGPNSQEPGQLLITNLWNRSFPFIRYANGDCVTFATEPCPCGEPFPVLASLQGRTADILVFSNGRKLAGPALTLIFRNMDILGWQVIQVAMNALEIHVASSKPLEREQLDYIKLAFSSHVGDDVGVEIKEVKALKLTRSGKLKPVINLVSENK